MKMLEKRPFMRKVTEHIEMKLLASEEPCTVVLVQDAEEDYCSYYKDIEHPLVSDAEEDYPVPHVQTPPQQHFNLKRVLSVGTEDLDDCHLAPVLNEDMEIELEEFPPFNTSQSDRVVKTSGVPPFRTPTTVET